MKTTPCSPKKLIVTLLFTLGLATRLFAQIQSFEPIRFDGSAYPFTARFKEQGTASGTTFVHSLTGGVGGSGRIQVVGAIDTLYYRAPVSGFLAPESGHTVSVAFQARSSSTGITTGNLSIAAGLLPRISDQLGVDLNPHAFLTLQVVALATSGTPTQFAFNFRSRDAATAMTTTPNSPSFLLTNLNWYRLDVTFTRTTGVPAGTADKFMATASIYDLGATGTGTPTAVASYTSTPLANSFFLKTEELYPAIRTGAPTGCGVNSLDEFGVRLYPETSSAARQFPTNSGVVNVKLSPYFAVGNGAADDTTAIQAAIRDNVGKGRIIYFPNGTYLVKNSLVYKDGAGIWQAFLNLQGESRDQTIIKLDNNCAGFTSAASPKAVIVTASQNTSNAATGAGDQAFMNSVCNLTVDVGSGNAGAVGIDFLASNQGTVRDVLIKASGASPVGSMGLRMWRSPGPSMIKNVEVRGFSTGIRTAGNNLSNTFENIKLTGQTAHAIENDNLVLAMKNVFTSGTVPAYYSAPANAGDLLVLDQGFLTSTNAAQDAIVTAGNVLIRNSVISGFNASPLTIGNVTYSSPTAPFWQEKVSRPIAPLFVGSNTASLDLPCEETPVLWDNNMTHWVSVGNPLATGQSDNNHIQTAINGAPSGSVLYFPSGIYYVSDPIVIGPNIRHVVGMMSQIQLAAVNNFNTPLAPKPVFQIQTPDTSSPGQVVENLYIRMSGANGAIAFEQASSKPVTLKNIQIFCRGGAYRNTGGGKLFLEDFAPHGHVGDTITISTGQSAWARQLNVESGNPTTNIPMVTNNGGILSVLGFKTEDQATFVKTVNGQTEVLGGYHWLNSVKSVAAEAYRLYESIDSDMAVAFATGHKDDATDGSGTTYTAYTNFIGETRSGTTMVLPRMPVGTNPSTYGRKGHDTTDTGRVVPLYVADHP